MGVLYIPLDVYPPTPLYTPLDKGIQPHKTAMGEVKEQMSHPTLNLVGV